MATIQQNKQIVPNKTQSLVFVKNLISVSISSICFLRQLFPEDCFANKKHVGITIKALSSESNQEVITILKWLEEGVYESLKKHYVKFINKKKKKFFLFFFDM